MLTAFEFVSLNLFSHDLINVSTLLFIFFFGFGILFFVNDDNEDAFEGIISIGCIRLLGTLSTIVSHGLGTSLILLTVVSFRIIFLFLILLIVGELFCYA